MYKTNDSSCPTSDWISLNFDAIPTVVITKLFAEEIDALERIRPDKSCSECNGTGTDPGSEGDDCAICDGSGIDPYEAQDDSDLYDWPAAHGYMWTCEDRPEYRTALLESGFVVYTDESREGYFVDRLIVGIDGGGYSFTGQHWIPLRARLAAHAVRTYRQDWPAGLPALLTGEASREGEARAVERIIGL